MVRLAQVNMELARVEANFTGLSPGKHGWSINEYGDLTNGAASTGKVYNPTSLETAKEVCFNISLHSKVFMFLSNHQDINICFCKGCMIQIT